MLPQLFQVGFQLNWFKCDSSLRLFIHPEPPVSDKKLRYKIFKIRTSVRSSQKTVTTQLDPRQWVFPGNCNSIFWVGSPKDADLSELVPPPRSNRCLSAPCRHHLATPSPPTSLCSNQLYSCPSHSHAYCLGLISYSAPLFLPLIVSSSCCLLCWVIIIRSQHHHPSSHPPSLHPLVLRIMACSLSSDGAHQSTYLERCWTLQPQTPTSDQPGSFLFPHGPLGLLEQWWDATIAATIERKRRY